MNTLTTLSRFTARSYPKAFCGKNTLVLSSFSFSTERVPEEDYHNGHLMTEHLEYLQDMMEKTIEIEQSMDRLNETYAGKEEAHKNQELDEFDALFHQAVFQKAELSSHVTDLKRLLVNAKNNYAVDGPDGTADGKVEEDLIEVEHIIDYAAEHENKEEIIKQHTLEDAAKKDRARDPEHDW